MRRAMTLTMAGSAAILFATTTFAMAGAGFAAMLPRAASPLAVAVPAVSSNAHKGAGGAYGIYKGLRTGPTSKPIAPRSQARKPPYPYRYYTDESRGNYGCHRYGKRAIDTDNENWWVRYKACSEVGKD